MLNYEADLHNNIEIAEKCVDKFGMPYFLFDFEWYEEEDYNNLLQLIKNKIVDLDNNIDLTFQQQKQKEILSMFESFTYEKYQAFKLRPTNIETQTTEIFIEQDSQTQPSINTPQLETYTEENTAALIDYDLILKRFDNFETNISKQLEDTKQVIDHQFALVSELKSMIEKTIINQCNLLKQITSYSKEEIKMSKAYGLADIKKKLHIGADTFYKLFDNKDFAQFFSSNDTYKHICMNVEKAQKWLEQNQKTAKTKKTKSTVIEPSASKTTKATKSVKTKVTKSTKETKQTKSTKTKAPKFQPVEPTTKVRVNPFVFNNHFCDIQDLIDFINIPIPVDYGKLAPWERQLWYRCKKYQKEHQFMHPIEKLNLWSTETMERTEITKFDIISTFFLYPITCINEVKLDVDIPGWEYQDDRFVRVEMPK